MSISTSTVGNVTIGGTGSSYFYTGTGIGGLSSANTITISNGGTISGAGAGYTWKVPEEFVDAFPDFDRIQEMCKEYPGLKIAYEKFVTTYKLVKDHYDTPENERPLP